MQIDKARLERLANLMLVTQPEEIDCDAWLDLVGEYVEVLRRDGQPPKRLAVVEQHAKMCPECQEELDALLAATDD